MYAKVAAMTDAGRIREKNEDCFYVDGCMPEREHRHADVSERSIDISKGSVFGVFDGMGGYLSGEIASQIAAEETQRLFEKNNEKDPKKLLEELCRNANEKVCQKIRDSGNRMGTTASMVYLENNTCTLCNIGDSPIFLLRGDQLTRVSAEHTERAIYEKITGEKTDEKRKFTLTQNIGIFPDEMQIEPYISSFPIEPDDYLILCSDGLTDAVSKKDLQTVILTEKTPGKIVFRCIDSAMSGGGKDNITVICIHILSEIRALP